MRIHFFKGIQLRQALAIQSQAWAQVINGDEEAVIIGFECEPTISVGRRGRKQELVREEFWRAAGYAVEYLERGGLVTIHNAGQLVIFPVVPIGLWGARRWLRFLARVTQMVGEKLGMPLHWREDFPGLYSSIGKVVSFGLRIREKISTHGLAININNDLTPFSWVDICGQSEAAMDHLRTRLSTQVIFELWVQVFEDLKREYEAANEVDKDALLEQGMKSDCRLVRL